MKRFGYGVGWFALFFFFLALPSLAHAQKYVFIDPGHGLPWTGTMGYSGDVPEATVNLHQAEKLKQVLDDNTDAKVVLLRTTVNNPWNYSSDLKGRVEKANKLAAGNRDNSIYISIHHNASWKISVRGYDTHYFDRHNPDSRWPADPIQVHYSMDSRRLAYDVNHAVLAGTPLHNDYIDSDGIVDDHLYVTRNAQMPSILVELGFMTNPDEEQMVESSSFQWKAAKALAAGIDEYFHAYAVRDRTGDRMRVFVSKSDAITYAKAHRNVSVFDMNTQKTIFSNIHRDYGVYSKSSSSVDKLFYTENDAMGYAKQHSNVRVVNNKTGDIIWSNYLNENYQVKSSSNNVLFNSYQEQDALDYAKQHQNTSVVDKGTGQVLWSNYLPKKYEVYFGDKKLLNAFYSQDPAIEYAKTWSNTKVVNKETGKTVWTGKTTNQTYSLSKEVLKGTDRMLTAVEVSKKLYPNGFDSGKAQKVVVLTRALKFVDALSAAPLAAQFGNAPILLTTTNKLNKATLNEIKRLHTKKVVILGGPNAISTGIENQLDQLGYQTQRIHGDTRIKTDLQINSHLQNVNGVLVANGYKFADALSASSIAAIDNWAIILTGPEEISQDSLDYLKGKDVVIVGGDGVVSNHVKQQIVDQNGADRVVRLAGDDRYETLAKVLDYFKEDYHADTVIAATGQKFPDALTASALSARTGGPLFLFYNKIDLSKSIGTRLSEYGGHNVVSHFDIVGGVLHDSVIQQIDQKLHG